MRRLRAYCELLAKYTPEQIRASKHLRCVPVKFDEIPAIIESKKEFIRSYNSKDWAALETILASTKESIEYIDEEMVGLVAKNPHLYLVVWQRVADARQRKERRCL